MKLILSFILCPFLLTAQKTFPAISGKTLDGKAVQLPLSNGKPSVIALAFSRKSEDALKGWLQPAYDHFVDKGGNDPFDMASFYDVNFHFVPLVKGFSKVAEDFKKGTDKEYWPYVVDASASDQSDVQEKLDASSNDPVFYVVSPDGKILASEKGSYSESKMERLLSVLE